MHALAITVDYLLLPGHWLTVAAVLGAGLLLTRWRAWGRGLSLIVAAALLMIATIPVHTPLTAALENRFPVPQALPTEVAGIVVLGGSSQVDLTVSRQQVSLGASTERLFVTAELAQRFPGAKVVVAGGVGRPDLKEADIESAILERLGVRRDRLVLDRQSLNTFENLTNVRRLVEPRPDETWILVTSAAQLPRAVGVARKLGWPVVPYPADYTTGPGAALNLNFNLARNLIQLSIILHEWVGLGAYRLLGRSDEWFPEYRG